MFRGIFRRNIPGSLGSGLAPGDTPSTSYLSPAHSTADSVPTYTEMTEGTPSYTASSPSCSSEALGNQPAPEWFANPNTLHPFA